jgi:hypothetical protein
MEMKTPCRFGWKFDRDIQGFIDDNDKIEDSNPHHGSIIYLLAAKNQNHPSYVEE